MTFEERQEQQVRVNHQFFTRFALCWVLGLVVLIGLCLYRP